MSERSPRSPEPHLVRLRMGILRDWERLPPDHQARVCLVLLRKMFEAGWEAQLVKALEAEGPLLARDDLHRTQLSPAEIDALTDSDLNQVVAAMVAHFVQDAVWDELEFAARKRLEESRDPDGPPPCSQE